MKSNSVVAGFVIDDTRPDRHLNRQALAFVTGAIAAFAVPSALRRVFRIEAKMQQRIAVNGRHHDDVAATAAIAAAWTAARHVLLAAERQAAVAAIARFDRDSYFIN